MPQAAGRAHEFAVLFDGERPAFPAVPVATYGAAMLALQGIFAALVERERTGRGQRIETSLLRALSVFDLSGWAPGADRALRVADVPMLFYTVARTRDGVWLQFSQNSPGLFRAFLRALDLEHLLEQEPFGTAPHIADHADARALRAILLDRVRERSWDEWQAVFDNDPDVSAEPFAWPGDALAHPQLLHTGDSIEVDDPRLGANAPARTAGHGDPRRPASGAVAGAERPPSPLLRGFHRSSSWPPGSPRPWPRALLAELGARVIKIEPLDGDPLRRYGPSGLKCVQGKESITLDLKTTEGRDIVHRLAERADALVHNYRPGVPERLGIDDATLRALNPRLIYVYAASYGSTGPSSAKPAFHVTAGAVCGGALAQSGGDGTPGPDVELSDEELVRWSQRLTRCNEANPDFNAALAVATAVTMALYGRARTGKGQTVETRMMASNAYALVGALHRLRRPASAGTARRRGCTDCTRSTGSIRLGTAGSSSPRPTTGTSPASARRSGSHGCSRGPEVPHLPGACRPRRGARLASSRQSSPQRRADDVGTRPRCRARVACVQAHDGSHAAYIFDAPWAEKLGFVEDAAPTGLGPYRRYGRVVRTDRDVGPLGAADLAGAQTRSILTELGYADDQVEAMLTAGCVGTPA